MTFTFCSPLVLRCCAATLLLAFAAVGMAPTAQAASEASAKTNPSGCLCETIEDPRSPMLRIRSNEPLGDSGKQRVFPNFKSRCENTVLPFSHAELVTERQRFGQATITRMPEPGCTNCAPIEVHWLHEPTGHLEAELRVFRQIRHTSCCPG